MEHEPLIPSIHMADSDTYGMSYVEEDTNCSSKFIQSMQRCGGCCGLICCLPFLCCKCCGPSTTVKEGHRAAVLTFGKLTAIKPPGTYYVNHGSEQYISINIQVRVRPINNQTVITRDGVSTTVSAVCFYRVIDIEKALFSVANYLSAIDNLAQYTLEAIAGEHTLEDILQRRDRLSSRIFELVKAQTLQWGIEIDGIEIRDVTIPESLVRVMAIEAETMREGKAKLIAATAEKEAATAYAEAAAILASSEGAMQLRYLETLREISAEKNSTIIIPSAITGLLNKF